MVPYQKSGVDLLAQETVFGSAEFRGAEGVEQYNKILEKVTGLDCCDTVSEVGPSCDDREFGIILNSKLNA